ncbi:MAG: hypothetical protein IT530_12055 [Burkholderiales bacterium]|nr:hypothetical protein [Burkholderiales bacterium]
MGPILGVSANQTTVLIAFGTLMLASGHRGIHACRGCVVVYFICARIAENAAVLLTVVALTFGAVSAVTPLTAAAPICVNFGALTSSCAASFRWELSAPRSHEPSEFAASAAEPFLCFQTGESYDPSACRDERLRSAAYRDCEVFTSPVIPG